MKKPCPNNPRECDCRLCWLFLNRDDYNRLWGGDGVGPEEDRRARTNRVKIPCIYLGVPLEDPATCGCGTAVMHSCLIHGTCRKTGALKGAQAICLECNKHKGKDNG